LPVPKVGNPKTTKTTFILISDQFYFILPYDAVDIFDIYFCFQGRANPGEGV